MSSSTERVGQNKYRVRCVKPWKHTNTKRPTNSDESLKFESQRSSSRDTMKPEIVRGQFPADNGIGLGCFSDPIQFQSQILQLWSRSFPYDKRNINNPGEIKELVRLVIVLPLVLLRTNQNEAW